MRQSLPISLLLLSLVLGGGRLAWPVSYDFTPIDVPGATETQASGINDRGLIVVGGFVDDHGSFTPIGVPFPGGVGWGINDQGQIVGLFFTSGGGSGFLDDHGVFSRIDVPFPGVDQTQAFGINDQGQIVGGYHDSRGFHGFVFEQGVFGSLDVPFPGATETIVFGVNDQGQIVGQYDVVLAPEFSRRSHGFVDDHGSFTTIDVPGVTDTRARGINNLGQIVGLYFDSSGGTHGFVDDHGSFTTIDVPFPGAHDTAAFGINNLGQIVGFYFDSSGGHGFLATPVPAFRKCPLGQGFWKNHPGAWPVTTLTLGSQTYTQAQLLAILTTPVRGDASLILAHQLIAAKLNIANGSDPAPISSTIADADNLPSQFPGKLPYNVRTSSAIGQQMVNDANVLDRYNNGDLTPDCSDTNHDDGDHGDGEDGQH